MSLPLISQTPLAGPAAVGVKATVSVSDSPGAIVVPSGSEVVAAKAPPLGGLDFVIVMFVPPVLVTVKDFLHRLADFNFAEVALFTRHLQHARQARAAGQPDRRVSGGRFQSDFTAEVAQFRRFEGDVDA